jgi:Transcriptional regulator containing an amidase domain and an AraC-type DNA-binding HTH domain
MELSVIQKSLNEHIALQALYNSQNLAKLLSLSQRQLQRAYRLHLGISPQKWLISQRINRAKLLLIQGKRIKVIAAELGYTNASYFCIQFKAETGLTPSMFTQINRPVAKV